MSMLICLNCVFIFLLFLIFNILLSMSSYDVLTGDIFGKLVGPLS